MEKQVEYSLNNLPLFSGKCRSSTGTLLYDNDSCCTYRVERFLGVAKESLSVYCVLGTQGTTSECQTHLQKPRRYSLVDFRREHAMPLLIYETLEGGATKSEKANKPMNTPILDKQW